MKQVWYAAGIILLGLILWGGFYLIDAFGSPPSPPSHPQAPLNDSTFVFVSDTQSPLWPETFALDENRNEQARSMILSEICGLAPGAVFHGGDLVALGFNQTHWEPIDQFVHTLSEEGIPFYPVAGNHEYIIFRDTGARNFQARFPFARPNGYAVSVGPLAFVMLNSNFGAMTIGMIARQDAWYRYAMDSLEADGRVKGIVVVCHHAPLTNSQIVDPSPEVLRRFGDRYTDSPKGVLFLTGHCHAFEQFELKGKAFLVAGGGGGLQQPLLLGSERRWEDLFTPATEKRMFHFLRGRITGEGVEISVRMVRPDFSGFDTACTLMYPWTVSDPSTVSVGTP